MIVEPKLCIEYYVSAYDSSAYGDDRSRRCFSRQEAIDYATTLEKRFHPRIVKRITMEPIIIPVSF